MMKHLNQFPGNYFLSYIFTFYLLSVMALPGCSNSTDAGEPINLVGNWKHAGLGEVIINVLKPDEDGLLAGTEKGLYFIKKDEVNFLGLENHCIRGIVRTNDQSMLVGLKRVNGNHPAFLRQQDKSLDWEPFHNNYGGDKEYNLVYRLESQDSLSDTLFTTGCAARSFDGGKSWEPISDTWHCSGTGLPALLYINSHHSGNVWMGGVTGISQPFLFKSDDYGETWSNVSSGLSDNAEAVAYDVITHPGDRDKVLAGLGGTIAASNKVMKSTDGGNSWQVAMENTGIHTFARSRQNPSLIYASGRDASTKLFFAWTTDFGETWEKQILEEGPDIITTNDLAVMMVDGKEVLFFGTDQGLFTFTKE